jgi:hypothetical protein
VKKRILDPRAKNELFYTFLRVMGYNTPAEQEVLDLVQLSTPPRIPEPLPDRVTYVQIARDLVYPRDADRRLKPLNMKEQPTRKDWNSLWTHFIKTSDFSGVASPASGRTQENRQRAYYSRKLDGGLLSIVQAHLSLLNNDRPAPTQPLSEANAKAFIEAKLKELTELASKESKRPASAVKKKRTLDADAAVRVESQMYQRILRNDGFAGDYQPPAAEARPSSPRPGRRHRYRPAMTDPSIRDQQFHCRRGVMRRQQVKSCYDRQLDALRRHVKMRQLVRACVERPPTTRQLEAARSSCIVLNS